MNVFTCVYRCTTVVGDFGIIFTPVKLEYIRQIVLVIYDWGGT